MAKVCEFYHAEAVLLFLLLVIATSSSRRETSHSRALTAFAFEVLVFWTGNMSTSGTDESPVYMPNHA